MIINGIRYTTYKHPESIKKACGIIDKNKLYVASFQNWILLPQNIQCIVLASKQKEYVGCGIAKSVGNPNCGSKMMDILHHQNLTLMTALGIEGSDKFFANWTKKKLNESKEIKRK
jgi:hypothetical protein